MRKQFAVLGGLVMLSGIMVVSTTLLGDYLWVVGYAILPEEPFMGQLFGVTGLLVLGLVAEIIATTPRPRLWMRWVGHVLIVGAAILLVPAVKLKIGRAHV